MDIAAARTRTRPRWVNVRTVLGLVLFCAALLGVQRILAQADNTVPVWMAARDLEPGTMLTSEDVQPADVRLPGDVVSHYLTADRPLDGSVITQATGRGQLLSATWIATGEEALKGSAMTIPVTPEHAVGGALRAGERVDVYGTFGAGNAGSHTTVLVRSVQIIDVVQAGGLALDNEAPAGITVAVTSQEAARLAFAVHNAEIDIVRVTGERSSTPSATVRARDFP